MKEAAEPGREPKCLVCLPGSLPLSPYPQGVPGGFLNYVIE